MDPPDVMELHPIHSEHPEIGNSGLKRGIRGGHATDEITKRAELDLSSK